MKKCLASAALVALGMAGALHVNAQPADKEVIKNSDLEKTFLELSSERAKAMSEPELANAIAWLKDTIKEEEVDRQLTPLKKTLEEIAAKHPDTRGGRKAARALQVLHADDVPATYRQSPSVTGPSWASPPVSIQGPSVPVQR